MLEQMTHLLLLANAEQRLLLAPEKTVDNFPYECDYYLIDFATRTYTGRLALGGHLDICTFTIGRALEDVLFDIATGKSTDKHLTRLLEDPKHGVRRLGIDFEGQLGGWEGTIMLCDVRYQKT